MAEVLLVLSVAAMFIASVIAVFEQDTKRMLAYSSLAQIGYITLGVSLANASGLTGGIVHLFNHALMKTALFLSLGAVAYRIGSVKLADVAGIGRRMPQLVLLAGPFLVRRNRRGLRAFLEDQGRPHDH